MRIGADLSLDLVKEFRLRKWARAHYVSPDQRGRQWHPIVLEEMSFRDAELAEQQAHEEYAFSPYVPLAPSEIYHFDAPHAVVPAPKSLQQAGSDRELLAR